MPAKAEHVKAASAADADPLDDLRANWETQVDFGVANPALFRLLSDPDRVERPEGGPIATVVAFRAIAPRLGMLSDAGRHLLAEWLDRTLSTP